MSYTALLTERWRRFRSNYWRALAFDALALAALLLAIQAWQTRDLPIDRPAPLTELPILGGTGSRAAVTPGTVGVIYFFAPWCRICRASIANVDDLVRGGGIDWGVVIALDYSDPDEVALFLRETGVTLPALLGDGRTAADWSIAAFPTYFVIDAGGRIHSRSVGYSTGLGMRWRAWLAK